MMLRRIIVVAGLAVAAGSCLADASGLQPRQPTRKTPTAMLQVPEDATGRLIVKFRDEVKARPSSSGSLQSLTSASLNDVEAVFKRYRLTARPAINHSPDKLAALEARAAKYSGRAQPDLAGMLYVDGPRGNLLNAARALNELEQVEFVQIEELPRVMQEEPDCGTGDFPDTGDCYDPVGNETPFCNEEDCCRFICDNLDAYCCGEDDAGNGVWDYRCAASANWLCPNGDKCASPLNGSCFEAHSTPGCSNADCCDIVCTLDDRCCTYGWDEACVELARESCVDVPTSGPTPDFETLQGYKTAAGWGDTVPEGLQAFVPMVGASPFQGYGGHGWNLQDPDDEYGGLHGIAQELLDLYGVDGMGQGNLSWGKTIKVAVIEWAYWGPEPYTDSNDNGRYDPGEPYSDLNDNGQWDIGHEDLDVISEPGQTLIQIPELTNPDHATACLSIINAVDNGFGVTGIAPDAQAYFFPLTSVEEGPRELTAWVSAMDALSYGDVISCSYGPTTNLNNSLTTWTLIRLATDLGITSCIAAGNDCLNLDDAAEDLGDSGAMVVGACSPGSPWYRLAFSNYCTNPPGAMDISNMVHIKAWGDIVTAAGGGQLFNGDGDPLRSYTPYFNGTSAATPQIAGLVACLQGLAKQFYGIPLTPLQIRIILGCPGTIPEEPSRLLLNGGFGDVDCGLDVDPTDGPNMIGDYPSPVGAASDLITQGFGGFDDSPLIDAVYILRGNHIFGNAFSIKGSEDWYLVVQSQYTQRNDRPNGGTSNSSGNGGLISDDPLDPNGPAGQARYLATGQIVDLMVLGHSDIPVVNSLQVTTEIQYPGQTALLLVELYDWVNMKWQFVNVAQLTGGGDGDIVNAHVALSAGRYVRPTDDTVFIRLWTFGLGGYVGGDQSDTYNLHVDWVNLELSEYWDAFNDG